MRTPFTLAGLTALDHLPALDAVRRAWVDPGPGSRHHYQMQIQLAEAEPEFFSALTRLGSGPTPALASELRTHWSRLRSSSRWCPFFWSDRAVRDRFPLLARALDRL